jgi:hypothetical protein
MPDIKAAKAFWMWFMSNEIAYLNLLDVKDDEKEVSLGKLFTELRKYSKGLRFTFDFSNRPRPELVITAKGNADLFEDVMLLIHHAPTTNNWTFVNFISKMEVPELFLYEDVMLCPDDIYFTARRNGRRCGLLDLCLYIKASKRTMQSEELFDAANLLLLHLLGETNFGACIGTFSVHNMPVGPARRRLHKLRELPEFVSARNVIRKLVPVMESPGIIV